MLWLTAGCVRDTRSAARVKRAFLDDRQKVFELEKVHLSTPVLVSGDYEIGEICFTEHRVISSPRDLL